MAQTTYLARKGEEIQFKRPVVAKTAAYTVKAEETGTIFTTEGAAGAVAFTLPAAAAGLYYDFVAAEDQNMQVIAPTADTIITFNDVAADNVIFSTAGNKAGGWFTAFSDGAKWFVVNKSNNTLTVNT